MVIRRWFICFDLGRALHFAQSQFYGHPSSLLEITETEDGIPEMTFADSTSPQMEHDFERVLSEIAAGYIE